MEEDIFDNFLHLLKWFNKEGGIDRENLDLNSNYLKFKEFYKSHKNYSQMTRKSFEILTRLEETEGHFVENFFNLFQIITLIENSRDPLIEWRIESFEAYLKDVLERNYRKIEAYWNGFKGDAIKFSEFVGKSVEVLGDEFLITLFPLVGKKE